MRSNSRRETNRRGHSARGWAFCRLPPSVLLHQRFFGTRCSPFRHSVLIQQKNGSRFVRRSLESFSFEGLRRLAWRPAPLAHTSRRPIRRRSANANSPCPHFVFCPQSLEIARASVSSSPPLFALVPSPSTTSMTCPFPASLRPAFQISQFCHCQWHLQRAFTPPSLVTIPNAETPSPRPFFRQRLSVPVAYLPS